MTNRSNWAKKKVRYDQAIRIGGLIIAFGPGRTAPVLAIAKVGEEQSALEIATFKNSSAAETLYAELEAAMKQVDSVFTQLGNELSKRIVADTEQPASTDPETDLE